MLVEAKLAQLGLSLPDLDRHSRGNAAGARFISHLAVGHMLYLSGTTPVKDGRPYLPGIVGTDLTLDYDISQPGG